MTDPVTIWLLASIPLLVVLTSLLYLWRGRKPRMEENRRRKPKNSFLGTLITQPDNSRVWGVDTSGWDGNVDFSVTRLRGASFAIIKCTEGTVNTKYFIENTNRARLHGLITGPYHWLHQNSRVPAATQAEAAWNRIKGMPRQLPLFVDFEETRWNGIQANPNYIDLGLFVDEFTKRSGYKPVLYSSQGYMSQFGPMPLSLRNKFSGLWVANYGVSKPNLPAGWVVWDFWQFSCEGDAAVIAPNDAGKKEIDLNYFNGTLADLRRIAGVDGDPDPTPIPDEEDMTLYGTVLAEKLNIRSGPGTSYPDVGDLLKGDQVEASENLGGWWKLTKVTRGGVSPIINLGYAFANSGLYIRTDTPPAPAPAAGRVEVTITARVTDAAGRVYEKTIAIDEPLEAV